MKQEYKPLVTICVIAYNQESIIEESILGVLNQDYSPTEIILSDDCSTDKTYEIMEKMALDYKGPHTIILNKNSSNMFVGRHIGKIIKMAKGEWIVMNAGDDISYSNRISKIIEYVNKVNKNVDCIYTTCKCFCEKDKSIDRIVYRNENEKNALKLLGAGLAISKKIAQKFPKITYNVYNEDKLFGFRAILLGGFGVIDDVLVMHRENPKITKHIKGEKKHKYWANKRYLQAKFDYELVCQMREDLKCCEYKLYSWYIKDMYKLEKTSVNILKYHDKKIQVLLLNLLKNINNSELAKYYLRIIYMRIRKW